MKVPLAAIHVKPDIGVSLPVTLIPAPRGALDERLSLSDWRRSFFDKNGTPQQKAGSSSFFLVVSQLVSRRSIRVVAAPNNHESVALSAQLNPV
jgi:hypothetical protein